MLALAFRRVGRALVSWNGTIVAFACGRRPTMAARRSAVRSCSKWPQPHEYKRRGNKTETSVSPSARVPATRSTAALAEPPVAAFPDLER